MTLKRLVKRIKASDVITTDNDTNSNKNPELKWRQKEEVGTIEPRVKKIFRRPSLTHQTQNIPTAKPTTSSKNLANLRIHWVNSEETEDAILAKGAKGKEMADIILAMNNEAKEIDDEELELIPLPDFLIPFDDAIEIYEHNQQYWYNILMIDPSLSNKIETIKEISQLEQWFILIIEPKPNTNNDEELDYWKEKELHKLTYWRSYHCLEELDRMIKIDDITKRLLRQELKNNGISL